MDQPLEKIIDEFLDELKRRDCNVGIFITKNGIAFFDARGDIHSIYGFIKQWTIRMETKMQEDSPW